MTDAPLTIQTSRDGVNWSSPKNLVNGYSDYGLQMAVYRGEIYGIMTQTVQYPKQLFATKLAPDGWRSWKSLPSKLLSQGRVYVTTLDDRFFMLRRGTNDAVYLASTDNFEDWNDLGRVGSVYAKTGVAPAMAAYSGRLFMAGAAADGSIYYTITDREGKRSKSWTKIDGTGTRSALSMEVLDGKLYLFHVHWNSTAFFYQSYDEASDSWSELTKVVTNCTSGLSLTAWKYNQLAVSFRGKDQDVKTMFFDGKEWSPKRFIPSTKMGFQTGLASWGGLLYVSYANRSGSSNRGYAAQRRIMSEKSASWDVEEVEDREWECKWDEAKQRKSWVRSMFCL